MLTIVETRGYLARAEKLLSEAERDRVTVEIAAKPDLGAVMRGTGGVRKARFAMGGRGKSAGVRVIYYFYNETLPAFLLMVYAKNEKDNITQEQRNKLADAVKVLRDSYGVGRHGE